MRGEAAETVEAENKQVERTAESAVDTIGEETPMEFHEEFRKDSHEEFRKDSHEESGENPLTEPTTQPIAAEVASPNDVNAAEKPEETKRHYSNHRRGPNDVGTRASSFRRTIVLASIVAEGIR